MLTLVVGVVGGASCTSTPKGDVIVIDNASVHHSQTIDEVLAAGCKIWYFPAYSPDLKLDRASVIRAQELDAATVG